jgi:hypothetical protein
MHWRNRRSFPSNTGDEADPFGVFVKPDIERIEAVDDQIAVSLREMGPAKRLALVFQAERFARDLMRAGARYRHPEWNEADVEKEVARLWADASQSESRRWNITGTQARKNTCGTSPAS